MAKLGKQYSFYLSPRHKYILRALAKSVPGWTEPEVIRQLIEIAGRRAGVDVPPELPGLPTAAAPKTGPAAPRVTT